LAVRTAADNYLAVVAAGTAADIVLVAAVVAADTVPVVAAA
jgi:hypothetical protein